MKKDKKNISTKKISITDIGQELAQTLLSIWCKSKIEKNSYKID